MSIFKVAFSLLSYINQSVCITLERVLNSQSYFGWALYKHWGFPISKEIIPMLCPIAGKFVSTVTYCSLVGGTQSHYSRVDKQRTVCRGQHFLHSNSDMLPPRCLLPTTMKKKSVGFWLASNKKQVVEDNFKSMNWQLFCRISQLTLRSKFDLAICWEVFMKN